MASIDWLIDYGKATGQLTPTDEERITAARKSLETLKKSDDANLNQTMKQAVISDKEKNSGANPDSTIKETVVQNYEKEDKNSEKSATGFIQKAVAVDKNAPSNDEAIANAKPSETQQVSAKDGKITVTAGSGSTETSGSPQASQTIPSVTTATSGITSVTSKLDISKNSSDKLVNKDRDKYIDKAAIRNTTVTPKTKKAELKNKAKVKKETLEIGNRTIDFFKVSKESYGIKYPLVDWIMGLPPLTLSGEPSSVSFQDISSSEFNFDVAKQLEESFPILIIQPLDITYDPKETKKDKNMRRGVVNKVKYKFAVQPEGSVSYSHSNTYGEASFESMFKNLAQWNTTRDIKQFMQVGSGLFGDPKIWQNISKGVNDTTGKFQSNLQAYFDSNEANSGSNKDINNAFRSLGMSASQLIMDGARIDMPNIWQDSSTQSAQSFTIELYTLAADPGSYQYWHDIIVPLYVLQTLAMPIGGTQTTYSNPPYITCSLDNSYMEVKLGGITSISWDAPLNEFNYIKVPRHFKIQLSIQDMYAVMTQDGALENGKEESNINDSFMTKQKMIQNILRPKGKKVTNAQIIGNEFGMLGSSSSSKSTKKNKSSDSSKANSSGFGGLLSSTNKVLSAVSEINGNCSAITNTIMQVKDLASGKGLGIESLGSTIGEFSGLKNVITNVKEAYGTVKTLISTGRAAVQDFKNIKASITNIGKNFSIEGVLNGNLIGSVTNSLNGIANFGSNMSELSTGVLNMPPNNLISGIGNALTNTVSGLTEKISDDGNSLNIFGSAVSFVNTLSSGAAVIGNGINAIKDLRFDNPQEALDSFQTIMNSADVLSSLTNATKASLIDSGIYNKGQIESSSDIQSTIATEAENQMKEIWCSDSTSSEMLEQYNSYRLDNGVTPLYTPSADSVLATSSYGLMRNAPKTVDEISEEFVNGYSALLENFAYVTNVALSAAVNNSCTDNNVTVEFSKSSNS